MIIWFNTVCTLFYHFTNYQLHNCYVLRVSCQKGPTRHAYAWQIGPFWQDTLDISYWMLRSDGMGLEGDVRVQSRTYRRTTLKLIGETMNSNFISSKTWQCGTHNIILVQQYMCIHQILYEYQFPMICRGQPFVYTEGILTSGPYLPCVNMAGRARFGRMPSILTHDNKHIP